MDYLLPHHLDDLRRSGLSDATITACGFRSETSYERLATIVKWSKWPKRLGTALVIPFRDATGTNGYSRLKPDNPRLDRDGKPIKYESPKGERNRAFIAPGTFAVLGDPAAELLITEGEKKAAKADQEGFPCVGLVGVFGWKTGDSERLLPELESIAWQGRQVRIVFDSDITDKPEVRDAESRLAAQLVQRGAVVRVVRLPDGPPGTDAKPAKCGLDDFLVAQGPTALRKLLDTAEEPAPVNQLNLRVPASLIDADPEAERYIAARWTRDGTLTLRRYADEFFRWDGVKYARVPDAEIAADVWNYLAPGVSKLNRTVVGNIVAGVAARSCVPSHRQMPTWLDEPGPWPAGEILATRNELIHLPSLAAGAEYRSPPTPKLFSTVATDYAFEPTADCPRFLQFLGELWPDDPQAIALLQEWFGYCLLPDTRQQKILLLIGPKRSGKGTIARILRAVVGPDNVAGPTLAGLGTNFGLWPLIGKSLAIISDARLSARSDMAQITERLLSISGEDALTIDRKCLQPITTRLFCRFVVLTNELPRLTDASGALASRFLLLPLTQSFYGRENTKLTDELLSELPGVLNWAIAGWQRLTARGRFEQADSGREMLEELDDLTSPAKAFAQDCLIVTPDGSADVDDVYAAWCQWCREHGREHAGTVQVFGRDLRAAVPTITVARLRSGEARRRTYEGLFLSSAGWDAARKWQSRAQA